MISRAGLCGDEKILDFGTGTATLSLMLKKALPGLQITAIDVDEKVLRIAKSKIGDTAIQLVHYGGERLPFENNTFDCVVSSLVMHHLTDTQKKSAFHEILRVIQPGGRLVIADWGLPANRSQRLLFYLVQLLDGFETTTANLQGLVPNMITAAGFRDVMRHERFQTVFGTLEILSAQKA